VKGFPAQFTDLSGETFFATYLFFGNAPTNGLAILRISEDGKFFENFLENTPTNGAPYSE